MCATCFGLYLGHRIEQNNNRVRALPGPMHLGFKIGPLCPIIYIELWDPCSRWHPMPNFLISFESKKKEARYECLRYLLSEFPLTGALRRILAGVPYCGAVLKLWITLNLNPTGCGEVFGPPSRAPILGKAKYNWEVARYPRGCR